MLSLFRVTVVVYLIGYASSLRQRELNVTISEFHCINFIHFIVAWLVMIHTPKHTLECIALKFFNNWFRYFSVYRNINKLKRNNTHKPILKNPIFIDISICRNSLKSAILLPKKVHTISIIWIFNIFSRLSELYKVYKKIKLSYLEHLK